MAIINEDTLKKKIDTLLQENQMVPLDQDSTDSFQKHIKKKSVNANDKREHHTVRYPLLVLFLSYPHTEKTNIG